MKRNLTIRYSAGILIAMAVSATSCKKFGDTNVSPNSALVPVTSALLTSAETYISADAVGSFSSTVAYPISGFYTPFFVQHWSQIQYPDNSLYPTSGVSFDSYYINPLKDLQNILDILGKQPANAFANGGNSVNQIQIARILKAYYFSILTDRYGDVPYSKALGGAVAVPYDKQQDIYTDLFKELTSAVSSFQSSGGPITGDIVYGGSLAKWKKFANSLRLSLALRLSKVDPATGKTQFLAALNDAGGVISSNSDNFQITFPGGSFNYPIYNLTTASVVAISKFMADKMNGYKDPRITAYGEVAADGTVSGFPYGLNRTDAQAYIATKVPYSLAFAKTLKTPSSTVYIFTAAYVNLLRAEAAITYSTGENSSTLLTNGITASWAQWGTTGGVVDVPTYIVSATAANGGSLLKTIQEQEWIALFGSEQNAYDEWRRTGIPALTPAIDATNPSKQIPRRFPYGSTEASTNGAAYSAAVAAMPYGGADNEVSRVWWDKP